MSITTETGPGIDALAVQKLPPDLVLMKMENEQIMTMAAARPRDHGKIKDEIVGQMTLYPSFAAEAVYTKPVGKDPDTHVMKFASGLSIRAAESLREAYGFNRVGTCIEPIPGSTRDEYRLTATFVDYQKGMVWQDSEIITPFYRTRGGNMVRMPDDRFFNVHAKARRSILVREVILRSVPAGLKSEVFEMANRLMDERLDDATIEKITKEFATIGVEKAMLEELIGRTTANWSKTDRKTILGIWQAIKDGETTIDEAFGREVVGGESVPNITKGDAIKAKLQAKMAKAEEGQQTLGDA